MGKLESAHLKQLVYLDLNQSPLINYSVCLYTCIGIYPRCQWESRSPTPDIDFRELHRGAHVTIIQTVQDKCHPLKAFPTLSL